MAVKKIFSRLLEYEDFVYQACFVKNLNPVFKRQNAIQFTYPRIYRERETEDINLTSDKGMWKRLLPKG